MGTLHLPENLPGAPDFDEIRKCPIRSRIDNITIKAGLNPPVIDASNMIMHVSDTPSCMFPFLNRTLKRLRPAWVVHTGDLVDNVKLQLRPKMLDIYARYLSNLIKILIENDCGVILITGNHDHLPTLLNLTNHTSIQVWNKPGNLYLGNFRFSAGHSYEEVKSGKGDYKLYGHSMSRKSFVDERGHFFLNGLESMNLIDMETGDVTPLRYPPGTYNARLDRKIASF